MGVIHDDDAERAARVDRLVRTLADAESAERPAPERAARRPLEPPRPRVPAGKAKPPTPKRRAAGARVLQYARAKHA